MIIKLYSVHDCVNESFGPITMANNNEVAIRNARYSVNNDTQLKSISNDLELYLVGEFDLSSGIVKALDKVMVIRLGDLVEKEV